MATDKHVEDNINNIVVEIPSFFPVLRVIIN